MKISAKVGAQVVEVTIERSNGHYVVEIDGVRHEVDAHKLEADFFSLLWEGRSYEVSVEARGDSYHVRHGAAEQVVSLTDPSRRARELGGAAEGPANIVTLMPGKVVRVLARDGDKVEAGQGVVVVEAMKMENELAAPRAGRVRKLVVEPGQSVEAGAVLAVIEDEPVLA
jgi:biotin carboxyl carrier protein